MTPQALAVICSLEFSAIGRRILAPAIALPLMLAPLAQADVTTTGSVLNNPPSEGGSFPSTEVVVGDEDDDISSILGTMRIDGGTDLLLDRLIIGDEEEYIGDVVVTGAGTTLQLDSSFVSNPALQVGHEGTGYLTVTSQAAVHVTDSNGNVAIGRDATSAGFVQVDGLRTLFTFGEDLIVGNEGYGELKLTGGALMYATDVPDSSVVIGAAAGGVGRVEVTGERSLWQLPETTIIGVTGAGALHIADGATVDGNDGRTPGITVGARGAIEMDGGRLFVDALTVDGRLAGHGFVTGPVTVGVTGELAAAAGEKLRLTGAVTNAGVVNVSGGGDDRGEIEFLGAVTNGAGAPLGGRIAVGDGVVRFAQPLTNEGTLASTSGVTDFHGDITNAATGLIAVGGRSTATYYGNVDIAAGALNIAAGSTALFLGDITISAGVNLAIGIDASAASEGFDTPLQSLGELTLDAPISLSLASGFVPEVGATFELISAAGGLNIGVIDPNNFDPLPSGLQWDVLLTNDSVLAVVMDQGIDPGGVIEGDYNSDGVVDAIDYAVWRESLGQTGGGLAADGDGSGVVDAFDLQIWRDNYGRTTPNGAGSATPEPTAALLLLAGLAALTASRPNSA